MPFRARLKRALTRNSTSEPSTPSDPTDPSQNHVYYQPGEKIPTSKYRRPVDKQHKERLEAFSFGNAWRRKSTQSLYSPMGSRLPSRKNSVISNLGRKSFQAARRISALSTTSTAKDDSATNGSLSRKTTRENRPPTNRGSVERPPSTGGADAPNPKQVMPNQPNGFTQEELSLALKRSHLEVPS